MVARPDELGEATWTRVADLRANTRRGSFKYTDNLITANMQPNVVLYEVRCSGLFGSICPVTTRVVEAGRQKDIEPDPLKEAGGVQYSCHPGGQSH